MKLFKLIIALVLFSTVACKEDKPKNTSTKKAATVQHYICNNKCEGSGGDVAANCPTCNTPYTHNVAYHNNDLLKSGPINVKSNATRPDAAITTTPSNRAPEPAQNALGVYHYTCSKGCAGGAGSAVSCKSCGELLAHNTTYHN